MNLKFLLLIIITLFIIIFLFINFLNVKKINKYEKRFALFSFHNEKEKRLTLLKKIKFYIIKFVKLNSSFLKLFKINKFYAKKYQKLEIENSIMQDIDYVSLKLIIGILFLILSFILNLYNILPKSLLLSIFLFLFGFNILDYILFFYYRKIKKSLNNNLYKAICLLCDNLETKNFINSIHDIISDLSGPIKNEFKIIYKKLKRGITVDECFINFYEKYKLKTLNDIKLLLILTDDNTVNYKELFLQIKNRLEEKEKYKKSNYFIKKMSSLLFLIFSILPIVLSIILLLVKKTYFDVFFKNSFGLIIFIIILLLYIVYIGCIKYMIGDDECE